jgi:hypothetical protein
MLELFFLDPSRPIERVEEFKYLGTTLTDQNSIQEEIKGRLKLGNAESVVFQVAIQKL